MAAIRISPGIYEVNGKRVNAKSSAEAEKMGGAAKPKPGTGKPVRAIDPRILPKKTKIKGVSDAVDASQRVADVEATTGTRYANPNQQGALGDRRDVIYDENGMPTEVRDTLSQGQQGIVSADDQISQQGRNYALQQLGNGQFGQAFNPQLTGRMNSGDLNADRQRIEDSVFKSLTRNLQRDRSRDMEEFNQQMANRGIPVGSELYNKQQQELNQRYDDMSQNAMGQAVQFGGDEFSRGFGIQEQLRANQFNEQQGTRNQGLGEIGALSGIGPGLRTSNFQGYQGVGYDLTDPVATDLAYKANRRDNRAANAALRQLGRGRGGGQPQQPPSPFYSDTFGG